MNTRRTLAAAAALAAGLAAGTATMPAAAQEFPSETVRLVVPYSAGGGQDRWSRVLASSAIDHLGQAIHVQVRPGAGGTVGWRYMLDQPADGHTLMIGSLSPMIAVLTEPNAPMTVDDVKLVAIVSDFNSHLIALPGDYDSWEKVSAYAKENPGQLTIGGTLAQTLAAASVFSQAGLEATFVPYPGTSKAVTDMLGGHIDMAVVTPATVASLGDQAVPVLNLGSRPNSEAFDKTIGKTVPWVGDLGYKGLPQPRWIGVHPDTPDDRVARLEAGLKAITEDKSVQRLISNLGEEIIWSDAGEARQTYADLVEAIEKNAKLLQ